MLHASPRAVGGFVCQSCTVLPRSTISSSVHLLGPSLVIVRGSHTGKTPWYKFNIFRWINGDKSKSSRSSVVRGADHARRQVQQTSKAGLARRGHALTDPAEFAELAEQTKMRFFAIKGFPGKQQTMEALQSCLRAAAALQPHLMRAEEQASVSRLALLSAERTGKRIPISAAMTDATKRIAIAAWAILNHPDVEMTAEVIETYVQTQRQLGRAESLEAAFELYANKSRPVVGDDGVVTYKRTNPNSVGRAIEKSVVDMALQTAIETKDLDSALGIIEAGFATTAYKRYRVFKYTSVPTLGVTAVPFVIYGLANIYAHEWQNTMDVRVALTIGIMGFSCYALTVGSLGLMSYLGHKDHMKRVTWLPGTQLRYRWIREDERAALDKVAVAWGYKEEWRHGEETGPDWEALHDYMGYRWMILDRVEFIKGVN